MGQSSHSYSRAVVRVLRQLIQGPSWIQEHSAQGTGMLGQDVFFWTGFNPT